MPDDDNAHANAVAEQLRQAEEDGDIPDSTEEHSSIRLHVDGEALNAGNPVDYLVMLLLEAKRYDGHWDGDDTGVSRWAVAQWCQELGWAPDLTDYNPGEQVDKSDDLECCEAVFYGERTVKEDDDDA